MTGADAPWDCLIVGGGPAGLSAATYLGRFRRRVLVIDAGDSRARIIPRARNVPGFPDGVVGRDLLHLLHAQAMRYGAAFLEGRAVNARLGGAGVELDVGTRTLTARTVLLATGVANVEPEIDDHARAVARGLLRYCPICDAHEIIDKRVAVIGDSALSVREIEFLQTYTSDLSLFAPNRDALAALNEAGGATSGIAQAIRASGDHIEIDRPGFDTLRFDTLYSCLGLRPRTLLAGDLSTQLSKHGGILVDAHQRTNVERVFAAGDVVEALDQIAVAMGHAAIAATAIHNYLRLSDAA